MNNSISASYSLLSPAPIMVLDQGIHIVIHPIHIQSNSKSKSKAESPQPPLRKGVKSKSKAKAKSKIKIMGQY